MKKSRVLSLLFAVLFLICASAPAKAAASARLIEGIASQNGVLTVYAANLNPDSEGNRDGTFSLFLDGTALQSPEVTTVGELGADTAYYFLVDCSGSMRDEIDTVRSVVTRITEEFGEGDCAIIGTLSETLETSGVLKDKEQIAAALGEIKTQHEETNLFEGIVKAVDLLGSSQEFPVKRCLVIFSDGVDYYQTGYTQHEAENAVEQCRFPVFSVAMRNPSERPEKTKLLHSLARLSCGGLSFDATNDADIGGEIVRIVRNGYAIKVALPNKNSLKDTAVLQLSMKSDSGSYEDKVTVETIRLDLIDDSENELSEKTWLEKFGWIIAVVLILLILVAVLIAIINKRSGKNRKDTEEEPPEEDIGGEEGSDSGSQEVQAPFTLLMQAVGYPDLSCKVGAFPDTWKTVGRGSQADTVLCEKDPRLTPVHCAFLCDGVTLRVRSLSGTEMRVNGVSLPEGKESSIRLADNRLIHLGSYDYKVRLLTE